MLNSSPLTAPTNIGLSCLFTRSAPPSVLHQCSTVWARATAGQTPCNSPSTSTRIHRVETYELIAPRRWLGQNSKQNKLSRQLTDVQARMRLKVSGDKSEIRQSYIPALFPHLVQPLVERGVVCFFPFICHNVCHLTVLVVERCRRDHRLHGRVLPNARRLGHHHRTGRGRQPRNRCYQEDQYGDKDRLHEEVRFDTMWDSAG